MKKSSENSREAVILKIKVEPRSSRSEVVGPYGDGLKVKLNSPPVEGKANKELIEVLAREFGIPKRDVEIISGQSSKNKTVRLVGVKGLEGVSTKLCKLINLSKHRRWTIEGREETGKDGRSKS